MRGVPTAYLLLALGSWAGASFGQVGLSMVANPNPVRPGEVVSYVLTVSNQGGSDLTGVELLVTIPAFAQGFDDDNMGGVCPGGFCTVGETAVFTLGTIPVGSSRTELMPVEIDTGGSAPPNNTIISNSATVTHSGGGGGMASADVVAHSGPGLRLGLKSSRSPIAPDEEVIYTLIYSNPGSIGLLNCSLVAPVPAGVSFVRANDGGTLVGGEVQWALGTVGSGESGQRTVTFRADSGLGDGDLITVSAEISDGAQFESAGATTTSAVESSASLALIMNASPDPVRPGEVINYLFTVSNVGNSDLTGVSARVLIPAYAQGFDDDNVGGVCPGGFCTEAETTVFSLGTIPAGQNRSELLPVEVDAGSSAPPDNSIIVNSATVTYSGGGGAATSTDVLASSQPGLALGLTGSESPVRTGENLIHTIIYGNPGALDLLDVTVRVPVPSGMAFVRASNAGAVIGNEVQWDLGTVGSGDSGQRTVTFEVDSGLVDGRPVSMCAQISDAADSASARASTHAAVQSTAPLTLSLNASPDPVRPGENVNYLLVVSNSSGMDLTGVEARVVIPSYAQGFDDDNISGVCPGGFCTEGETAIFTLGTIATGQSRYELLPVEVDTGSSAPPDNSMIPNRATVTYTGGSGAAASTDVASSSQPGLTLGMMADRSPITSGEVRNHTVTYGNPAVLDLLNGVLRVPVPAGMSVLRASEGGTVANGEVRWNLGIIGGGESGQKTLTLQVDSEQAAGDHIVIGAEVADSQGTAGARARSVAAVQTIRPLAVTMRAAPDPVRPGEVINYVLTALNQGDTDIAGVELRAIIPAYAQGFDDDNISGVCPGGFCTEAETAVFTFGLIPAGQSRSELLPVEVDTGSSAPPDISVIPNTVTAKYAGGGGAAASVAVLADSLPGLTLGLTARRTPAAPGQDIDYTLTYANSGDFSLLDVWMRVAVPRGSLIFADGFESGDTSAWSSGRGSLTPPAAKGVVMTDVYELTFDLGTLGPGERGEEVFSLAAHAAFGNSFVVLAGIADGLETESARAASVAPVEDEAPLAITATASPDPVNPGQVINYLLTVFNQGAVALTGVEIRAVIPSYAQGFGDSIINGVCPGGFCTEGETAVFAVGTILAGQSRLEVLPIEVDTGSSAPPDNTLIPNSAMASYAGGAGAAACVDVLAQEP